MDLITQDVREAFGEGQIVYLSEYLIEDYTQANQHGDKADTTGYSTHDDRDRPVKVVRGLSGYQLATLSQTMQRGYALGSIALAKKLKQESKSARTTSKKPTLPIRTR